MALTRDAVLTKRDSATERTVAGELKAGWRVVQFGDVVSNVDVSERQPLEQGLERFVGLDHLDPESLHIKRWGLIEEGTSFTRKFVSGQVLFGKRRAYQRKAAVAEFDGICSGDILVFEPKGDELLPELLPFIVQSDGFFEHALGTSAGSLSPRTKWSDLARYEFALPPKDEQRRIADILWAADKSCQSREQVVSELLVVQQLTIDKLFSVEKSQTCVAFRDVCEMQNGRPFPSDEYRNDGVKLLRPGNLGIGGYFDWKGSSTKYLPNDYLQTASDYVVTEKDVVINLTAQSLEDGFMGRVCIAREGDTSLLNQRIGRFRCSERVLPEYLFRCLQTTAFRKLVETKCEGSKVKHLYWRHMECFEFALPPKDKQLRLIDAAESTDVALRNAKMSLEDSRRLNKALINTLLPSNLDTANVQ